MIENKLIEALLRAEELVSYTSKYDSPKDIVITDKWPFNESSIQSCIDEIELGGIHNDDCLIFSDYQIKIRAKVDKEWHLISPKVLTLINCENEEYNVQNGVITF